MAFRQTFPNMKVRWYGAQTANPEKKRKELISFADIAAWLE